MLAVAGVAAVGAGAPADRSARPARSCGAKAGQPSFARAAVEARGLPPLQRPSRARHSVRCQPLPSWACTGIGGPIWQARAVQPPLPTSYSVHLRYLGANGTNLKLKR